MEDHRHILGHHLLGQRGSGAAVQVDVEDREIGLVLLEGEHRVRSIIVGAFDDEARFLDRVAKIVRHDRFVFGDEDYRMLRHACHSRVLLAPDP